MIPAYCDWGNCPNPAECRCDECDMELCDDCRFDVAEQDVDAEHLCSRCYTRGSNEP